MTWSNGKGKAAFKNMGNMLQNSMRLQLLRCYTWLELLNGSEISMPNGSMRKRIEAFEMRYYTRMLKITWMKMVTNEEVLQKIRRNRMLLTRRYRTRLRSFGHVIRRGGL